MLPIPYFNVPYFCNSFFFFQETGKFVFPAILDMSPYEEKASYDEDNIHKIHVHTLYVTD